MDDTTRNQLDTLTEILGAITSGTEYPDQQATMEIILKDRTPVTVWQSSNDPGFKWTTHLGPPTTSYQLDTITELLAKIATDAEPEYPGSLEFQLKNGAPVRIWKPANHPGFKWEHPPF